MLNYDSENDKKYLTQVKNVILLYISMLTIHSSNMSTIYICNI